MELARVLPAIGALRRARDGADSALLAVGVMDGILRALPADMVCFNEVDACARRSVVLVLWPNQDSPQPGPREAVRRPAGSDSGHALVMPLPAPAGNDRRLVFFRWHGYAFSDEDRSAAILLQPHIADALRRQSRHAAARVLTARQCELLCLVAAGHDNTAIARRLGLSTFTVRKHLENAFARLDVTSRTAAVAKVHPDASWLDPPP
jgi:DNA-binding CsgD family transcriptional regulator